jgi:hypothetical protein
LNTHFATADCEFPAGTGSDAPWNEKRHRKWTADRREYIIPRLDSQIRVLPPIFNSTQYAKHLSDFICLDICAVPYPIPNLRGSKQYRIFPPWWKFKKSALLIENKIFSPCWGDVSHCGKKYLHPRNFFFTYVGMQEIIIIMFHVDAIYICAYCAFLCISSNMCDMDLCI